MSFFSKINSKKVKKRKDSNAEDLDAYSESISKPTTKSKKVTIEKKPLSGKRKKNPFIIILGLFSILILISGGIFVIYGETLLDHFFPRINPIIINLTDNLTDNTSIIQEIPEIVEIEPNAEASIKKEAPVTPAPVISVLPKVTPKPTPKVAITPKPKVTPKPTPKVAITPKPKVTPKPTPKVAIAPKPGAQPKLIMKKDPQIIIPLIIERNPNDPLITKENAAQLLAALVIEAEEAIIRGDYAKALENYQIIYKYRKSDAIEYNITLLAIKTNNIKLAVKTLENSWMPDTDMAELLQIMYEDRYKIEAETALKNVLGKDKTGSLYFTNGFFNEMNGNIAGALASYRRAMHKSDYKPNYVYAYARMQDLMRNYDDAILYYKYVADSNVEYILKLAATQRIKDLVNSK